MRVQYEKSIVRANVLTLIAGPACQLFLDRRLLCFELLDQQVPH